MSAWRGGQRLGTTGIIERRLTVFMDREDTLD